MEYRTGRLRGTVRLPNK